MVLRYRLRYGLRVRTLPYRRLLSSSPFRPSPRPTIRLAISLFL